MSSPGVIAAYRATVAPALILFLFGRQEVVAADARPHATRMPQMMIDGFAGALSKPSAVL